MILYLLLLLFYVFLLALIDISAVKTKIIRKSSENVFKILIIVPGFILTELSYDFVLEIVTKVLAVAF